MKSKLLVVTFLHGVIGCQILSNAAAQDYQFVEVVYPGANETIVTGINDAGVIVGTYGAVIDILDPINLGSRGFMRVGNVWQNLQATGMGLSGVSAATQTASINNNGLVVGQYLTDSNFFHGFVYDGTTYVDIFPAEASGTPTLANEAIVSDIDDNGIVIGSYSTNATFSTYDPNDPNFPLDVHGFRAYPDGSGSYTYEIFNFPAATSTFGNARSNGGIEVGTGISESILGRENFGYVLPKAEYRYPPSNPLLGSGTQFVAVDESGVVLGNATLPDFDEGTFTLYGRTQAFFIDAEDLEGGSPTPEDIELPCPECRFIIGFDGVQQEAGRRAATNFNNLAQIVGYHDNNDGILRGFIGTLHGDGLSGDFDADDDVDGRDFLKWQRGESPNPLSPADLADWQANYGTGSLSTSTAVPESSTCIALLCGGIISSLVRNPEGFS